ncbi:MULTISPECIES: glutamate racemase [Aneurinibacillus]|uniref:Glutamate racemase n=1 Tax=Aneurinibacillus thermoaerophilus TaxID=143495 RepID=A0A1G7ZUI4_ANETH|nr:MULTISPECIES: glutamate racemase [Aneurinibacillus]AMA72073.1 glutamate racemase [Aneurinibacillus sp. XH2]MED0676355.1 glutamate racemase [Aneurinibacillus thermoaerophilus]MED0678867.1 glutamate racemase [Aneurinibacillus thermoaerophilus]MED0736404.1 glutamate racemase [Aneurinibacillus thermoaerophilus]MED0755907.1 glutamate racemase [Aneurinibacillus thermoaerophilus]
MKRGIGIIDSGVGGLTVAKEVLRQLPREAIYYFGDTARCPYGPRPAEEVRAFSLQMIEFLLEQDIKALMIGCNTAAAVVLQEVSEWLDIPVIGVIEPGARTAIKETKTGQVAVIGTEGTIRSGAYEKTLKKLNPQIHVESLACPALVPLVESGSFYDRKSLEIVRETLRPLQDKVFDALILGCTHYPLIAHFIQETVGPGVTLISSAEEAARELSAVLSHRKMLANGGDIVNPKHRFFTSGNPELFMSIAEEWLNIRVQARQVRLGERK